MATPYLTYAEEEELISFLFGCAAIGYPRTIKDVLAIVQDIINSMDSYRWMVGRFQKT